MKTWPQHAINAIWRAFRAESAVQFMKFITNLKPRSGQNRQTGTYSYPLWVIEITYTIE